MDGYHQPNDARTPGRSYHADYWNPDKGTLVSRIPVLDPYDMPPAPRVSWPMLGVLLMLTLAALSGWAMAGWMSMLNVLGVCAR